MNTFYEHHKDNIKFSYRCFDRILLNGLIQPFQQPERVIGFFNAYREAKRLTHKFLAEIAEQFGNWVKNRCQKWGAPLLEAQDGRRDDFVDRFFREGRALGQESKRNNCTGYPQLFIGCNGETQNCRTARVGLKRPRAGRTTCLTPNWVAAFSLAQFQKPRSAAAK
jgi:hypothetical protein